MSIQLDLKSEIISTLALFGAVAFRLIPTTTRLLHCFARIKFGIPIVNSLHNEKNIFDSIKDNNFDEIYFSKDIKFKNCSFHYENTSRHVLNNFEFELKKNEFVGIIGESGSGKTTLLNILLGLYSFTSGDVLVEKKKVNKKFKWRNIVGYVPQSIFIIDDTIKNNIILDNNIKETDQISLNKAIKNAQLEELINELPDGIQTKIGERGSRLSLGQVQRIGIARALYVNPDILFLDEPTSSLDPKTEEEFMNVINQFKGKKTIIMISHKEEILKFCDKILKVEKGNLFKIKNSY